ncbi:MAG: trypsin-like peptidase domain-containing protein [bacterium]|nr:trypsin-like peptidase domain-containing protein [bacterium]
MRRLLLGPVFVALLAGGAAGVGASWYYLSFYALEPGIRETKVIENTYTPQTTEEEKIIGLVERVSPSVVSIVETKEVPVIGQRVVGPFIISEQQGTEKREVASGSGFLVSEDGFVVTNRHVVLDEKAEYAVFTNTGKRFQATVLARDLIQDLAILKIEPEQRLSDSGSEAVPFPTVQLGNSDHLRAGQRVVAIGNALGEFRNTVSSGVISGLGRTITASGPGGGFVETIEDVIQTDAAINKGNSGGPLLNLAGEVIGVNTATVLDAQSIGFSIPVNRVKRDIEQVRSTGEISYAFLGVRYTTITEAVKRDRNLSVDYGVLLDAGSAGGNAVVPGSPAEKAGLKSGDIILEVNSERVTKGNSLSSVIQKYEPGDSVVLKALRDGSERLFTAILEKRPE